MSYYRIRAYSRMEREYGYVGLYPHYYQSLQVKRWWGWQTLDTEEVPMQVRIDIGTLGHDPTGWRSKFTIFGHWGRNGVVIPHTESEESK